MSEQVKSDPVVEAFFGLLNDYAYSDVTLAMVAERAGMSLGGLRREVSGKFAIVERFAATIDQAVLAGLDPELDQAGAHERLFDVLMRRLDNLLPYREAIRSLRDAARDDPGLALAFWRLATRSQRWMLAAADIASDGWRGEVAARGLALAFARLIDTWLEDEDPGLARTMAALDQTLRRGERAMRAVNMVERVVSPLRILVGRAMEKRRRRSGGRHDQGDDERTSETRH